MAPVRIRAAGARPATRTPPKPLPRIEPPRRPSRRRGRRRGFPITISLYLVAEILRVFALAVLAIALLYITVIGFQLVRDGIRLDFVWPHVLRTIAYPLFFSIPLAYLFGITLGAGRIANDQELSAMRVNGISHGQLFVPVLILSFALAGLTFYLSGWLLPEVHYEQANLRKAILDQLDKLGSGTNRTILLPGEVSLWVRHYDGPRLQGVVLDIQKGDRSRILPEIGAIANDDLRQRLAAGPIAGKITLLAKEADLAVVPDRSRVLLSLRGVEVRIPEIVSGARGIDIFDQTYRIERLPLPLSFARKGESAKDLINSDLIRWIASLRSQARSLEEEVRLAGAAPTPILAGRKEGEGEDSRSPLLAVEALGRDLGALRKKIARAECELHGRFAFTLACLTFPLVAFPLVLLLERQGRLTHFFLANLAVVVIFFPLVMAGNVAGDRGLPPALAMAIPNLGLAALGIPLLRTMLRR